MFEELKSLCLSGQGLKFHLFKDGLIVNAKITRCEENYQQIIVHFEGGTLVLYPNYIIVKKPRPNNLTIACHACFLLCNDHDEVLGYIYLENKDTVIIL